LSGINARTDRFLEGALAEDRASLAGRVRDTVVRIRLPRESAESFTGQAILFTLLNILVRLDRYCPQLSIDMPDVERHLLLRLAAGSKLRGALTAFFAPFRAAGGVAFDRKCAPVARTIELVIGPGETPGVLHVWAEGWIAYLNAIPAAVVGDPNVIGASVAAGLAASEIFKRLLAGAALRPGVVVIPVGRLVFSAFDYGLAEGENPRLGSAVDLGVVVLVGAGGIGSAFVAAAASLPALAGRLAIVDHDELDATNLNRHLVSRPGDAGAKVTLCRAALAFHPDVLAHKGTLEDFLEVHGNRHEIMAAAVDRDRIRRAIQESLPRIVLNAGTSDVASFRVTRHGYLHGACLSCIARDDLAGDSRARNLAVRLRLPVLDVEEYERSGSPVPEEVLRAAGLGEGDVTRFGGQTIPQIWQLLYNALEVLGAGDTEAPSISFLSALPGFLLLGEVVKEGLRLGAARPALNDRVNHLLLAVLGRPNGELLHGYREKIEGCDCTRGAWQRAYRRKWLGA
jgi:ThiF family